MYKTAQYRLIEKLCTTPLEKKAAAPAQIANTIKMLGANKGTITGGIKKFLSKERDGKNLRAFMNKAWNQTGNSMRNRWQDLKNFGKFVNTPSALFNPRYNVFAARAAKSPHGLSSADIKELYKALNTGDYRSLRRLGELGRSGMMPRFEDMRSWMKEGNRLMADRNKALGTAAATAAALYGGSKMLPKSTYEGERYK